MKTCLNDSTMEDLSQFLVKPITCSPGATIAEVAQVLADNILVVWSLWMTRTTL